MPQPATEQCLGTTRAGIFHIGQTQTAPQFPQSPNRSQIPIRISQQSINRKPASLQRSPRHQKSSSYSVPQPPQRNYNITTQSTMFLPNSKSRITPKNSPAYYHQNTQVSRPLYQPVVANHEILPNNAQLQDSQPEMTPSLPTSNTLRLSVEVFDST